MEVDGVGGLDVDGPPEPEGLIREGGGLEKANGGVSQTGGNLNGVWHSPQYHKHDSGVRP